MEFGIILHGSVFKHLRDADPDYEHRSFMKDLAVAQAADKAGFKYVWVSEHHFLDEYSHISANDVFLSYLAAVTERIHLGSGIFNPLPNVIHPAKLAETVAMLDHMSEGRFEFGTGRGAGSYEILGFMPELTDISQTREVWEDVIGEFAKMWLQEEYEGYEGKYWSLPPRKILPKPWKKPHPAMWYAAGNHASFEMAARKGLGVLGFSISAIEQVEPLRASYKRGIANAEPVGAFVNDNFMLGATAFVSEDTERAIAAACSPNVAYLNSNMYRFHDTFPHPDGVPYWPQLIPPNTPEIIPLLHEMGALIGDPDQALQQCRRWESAGVDQLFFGLDVADLDMCLETVRLIGEHVIPKIDKDPVHSTTRMRDDAVAELGS